MDLLDQVGLLVEAYVVVGVEHSGLEDEWAGTSMTEGQIEGVVCLAPCDDLVVQGALNAASLNVVAAGPLAHGPSFEEDVVAPSVTVVSAAQTTSSA